MRRRIVQWVAVVVGLFYLVTGLWAFFAPGSFFEQVATFPPYNHHLLHDVGAFQAGLGLVLLLALWWSDALRAALVAALIASALHTISHLVAFGRWRNGQLLDAAWPVFDGQLGHREVLRVPGGEGGADADRGSGYQAIRLTQRHALRGVGPSPCSCQLALAPT